MPLNLAPFGAGRCVTKPRSAGRLERYAMSLLGLIKPKRIQSFFAG